MANVSQDDIKYTKCFNFVFFSWNKQLLKTPVFCTWKKQLSRHDFGGSQQEKSLENLKQLFSKNALLRTQVFFWIGKFRWGRQSFDDEHWYSTPATAVLVTDTDSGKNKQGQTKRGHSRDSGKSQHQNGSNHICNAQSSLGQKMLCKVDLPHTDRCTTTEWVWVEQVHAANVQRRPFKIYLRSTDRGQNFYFFVLSIFIQNNYFPASNLTSSGSSNVGLLFATEEQKKAHDILDTGKNSLLWSNPHFRSFS